jgi:ketosteroid isomerase-like protein
MITDRTGSDFGSALQHIGLVVDLLRFSADEAVEEIAPLLHPQMQVLAAPGVAPARLYQTREDFLAYFADARAHDVLVEPDAREIRITPSGAVVVTGSVRMTTLDSIDETPAWFVYTFRDQLIASLETYLDGKMAAEAAADPVGSSADLTSAPKPA